MTSFAQPHNASLRRLISAVLAAYWLLAAITLCAPMVMAEQANAEQALAKQTASSHEHMNHAMGDSSSSMDDMPAPMDCCADNNSHTAVACDTGVSDDGNINHLNTDLDAPTLVLLASYLATPALNQPPSYPQHTPEHHSTYPRLHLQLSVQLD